MSFYPTTLAEAGSASAAFNALERNQSDSGRSTAASGTLSAQLKASPTISDAGYSVSRDASPALAVSPTSVAGRTNKLMEDLHVPRSSYDCANNRHPELDLAEFTGRVAIIEPNLEAMGRFSKSPVKDLSSNLEAMGRFSKSSVEDLSTFFQPMGRFSKLSPADLSTNLLNSRPKSSDLFAMGQE